MDTRTVVRMPYYITKEVTHHALRNAFPVTSVDKQNDILGYETLSGELVLNNTPKEKIYYNFATGSIRKEPFRHKTEKKTFRVFEGNVPGFFLDDDANYILDSTLDRALDRFKETVKTIIVLDENRYLYIDAKNELWLGRKDKHDHRSSIQPFTATELKDLKVQDLIALDETKFVITSYASRNNIIIFSLHEDTVTDFKICYTPKINHSFLEMGSNNQFKPREKEHEILKITRLNDNQFASLQLSTVGKPSCYINIWDAANGVRAKTIHLPAFYNRFVHLSGTDILIAMSVSHFCFIHILTGAVQKQEIAEYIRSYLPLRNGSLLIRSENAISVLQVIPTPELDALPHQDISGAVIGKSYTAEEEEIKITGLLNHQLPNHEFLSDGEILEKEFYQAAQKGQTHLFFLLLPFMSELNLPFRDILKKRHWDILEGLAGSKTASADQNLLAPRINPAKEYGFAINAAEGSGYELFLFAAKHENIYLMEHILTNSLPLSKEVELFIFDIVLNQIISRRKWRAVEYLLSLRESLKINITTHQARLLIEASSVGALSTVQMLIKQGVNVNITYQDRTALGVSFASSEWSIVKLLLQHQAQFNAYSDMAAISKLDWTAVPCEVLEQIFPSNSKIFSAYLIQKLLAKFIAAKNSRLTLLFIQYGCEFSHADIELACTHSLPMVVHEMKLKCPEKVIETLKNGKLIQEAIQRLDWPMIKTLLEVGSPYLDVRGEDGQTLLHKISMTDQIELLDLILGKIPNINAKDSKGRTPLYLAAKHGKLAVVKKILAKGADVSIKNNKGITAFARINIPNHSELITLLNPAGSSDERDDFTKRRP